MSLRKPCVVFFLCLLFTGLKSTAQKVIVEQGLGLAFSQSNVTGLAVRTTDSSILQCNYSTRLRTYGLVYQWRANLFQTKNISLSLGSPLMLGWSVSRKYSSYDYDGTQTDTVYDVRGTQIALEAPIALDLNFGLHSARDESRRSIGGYFGIGYSYSFTRINTSAGIAFHDDFQPLLRAGIRMGKEWDTRWSINFSVRGGFNSTPNRAYGIQILKEL